VLILKQRSAFFTKIFFLRNLKITLMMK